MPTKEEMLEARIRQELKALFSPKGFCKDIWDIYNPVITTPVVIGWMLGVVAWSIGVDIKDGVRSLVRRRAY